jgi:hypothetical protein
MVKVSEIAQLQELIDFYRSKRLLTCDPYHTNSYNKFFKDMLHSLSHCRQEYIFQCRFLPPGYDNELYFRWFITYVFFVSAYHYIEKVLYQLLEQSRSAVSLDPARQNLGNLYRILTETSDFPLEHTRSFDLLDMLNTRLTPKNNMDAEDAGVMLTTYNNHSHISTYRHKIDLINPPLLFAILKDIGGLLANQCPPKSTRAQFGAAPKTTAWIL